MEIILHRANDFTSLVKAHDNKWGVEVDIRSHNGKFYMAHDMIKHNCHLDQIMPLSTNVLYEWALTSTGLILLDFKESGIAWQVAQSFPRAISIDLLVPDQLFLKSCGHRSLSRRSQYENINITTAPIGTYWAAAQNWKEEYWVDYMFGPDDLLPYADIAACSFVVSPELHSQDGGKLTPEFIAAVYDMGFAGVCTDHPELYAERA